MMSSRGQEPDALSGLIAALSDPKATAKKLSEIKDAMDALDKRERQIKMLDDHARDKHLAADARYDELAKEAASLDEREAAIEKREERTQRAVSTIEAADADVKADRAALVREMEALRDEAAKWQKDVAAQRKIIDDSEASLLALDKALTARANALADKEAATKAVMDEYKAKLAALKALVN
jgi:chromosome segregation ATPase